MVLDWNPPIGQPAPPPAPVAEPDTTDYGGRECFFCHEKNVVADDIELLERGGPQKWCVCVRCFHHAVQNDKRIPKPLLRQVVTPEESLLKQEIRDHEKGGILE